MLFRYSRPIAFAIAGVLGVLLSTAPVAAVPEQTRYAPTMIVLDASGSMLRPDPSGTMMDAAKNAVRSFVESAPEQSRVGLAAYGTGTSNDEAEKAAGCADVKILHKPEPLDRAALISAVDGIQASGWTPVGAALRQAAQALPDSDPRSVVLVSDGEDTCAPPDPCEVARELDAAGVDLTVHAIGFAVDAQARAQLSCLADATGGSYTDASDGPALERALPRVAAAALRSYQATGTPVTGGPEHTSAPVITSGHYLDTIDQYETKYYAVDVPEGATVYFTGIVTYPRTPGLSIITDNNSVGSRVYGRDGEDCGEFESGYATHSRDGQTATVAQVWRGATRPPERHGRSEDMCRGAGRYYFSLRWKMVSEKMPQTLPLEVLVGIESAVTDPGPEPDKTPTAMVQPAGPAVPVVGGGSFTVATELPGSGRYTDVLRRGEIVFYRVHLDWGQGLAYRVRFEQAADPRNTRQSSIRTELYSPWAEEIGYDGSGYNGEELVRLPDDGPLATIPIRYANRDLRRERAAQSVAGWYYIAVKVGPSSDDETAQPVTVTIDLTVSGDPESGPTYTNPVAGGVFGETEDVGKTPAAEGDSAEATAQDRSSSPTLAAIAGTCGFLAVSAILLTWYLIRRRGTRLR
ncbi:vWA domain-containing protein [Nocardia shimofusensis]|uniref:vWA domain-containing protein n=1 Tax=Nocardia shimofusensis TaxID=228596 RepID=UPI0008343DC6|nr:VWA domain-containing protein [Nocardia shimofusensis]